MREASDCRTVTDTDSYAFLFYNQTNANEGMTAASIQIMCNTLRKVIFKLGTPEIYPNQSEEEKREMNELDKERRGYFHRWAEEVDNSGDISRIKTMALVESLEDGKMHLIEYYNLSFKDDWV